jgi:hypothetical protein
VSCDAAALCVVVDWLVMLHPHHGRVRGGWVDRGSGGDCSSGLHIKMMIRRSFHHLYTRLFAYEQELLLHSIYGYLSEENGF